MANSNYAKADLLKKIIFFTLSLIIIRFNYDNSISVEALSQNFKFLDSIITIIIPLAMLIIIFCLKEHNYKYPFYIAILLAIILMIDVLFIEKTDIIKIKKYVNYYPFYIILTYSASFMADLASTDLREKIDKIQSKIDNLTKNYILMFINIFFK